MQYALTFLFVVGGLWYLLYKIFWVNKEKDVKTKK